MSGGRRAARPDRARSNLSWSFGARSDRAQAPRDFTVTQWIDIAVLTLLSLLAVAGLEPAFGPYNYLLAGIGGLVLGSAVALGAARWRLGATGTVICALAAYFVFGSALAMPSSALLGVIPTGLTLGGLVLGAVFGWSDIVTLQTPIEAPPYIAVVPYVAAFVVSIVCVTLAARWLPRSPRTPLRSSVLLIAPAVLYVGGILLGTDHAYLAGVRGVIFAAASLIWLGWRHRSRRQVAAASSVAVRRRMLVGTAVVVGGAVLLGGVAGALVAPASSSRFVLRDAVQPPFDPQNYPSPLAGFREFAKNEAKTPLFSVTGLHEGEKIRMATLDSYNGQVWSVAGPSVQTDGSGGYELLGRHIPAPELFTGGARHSLTFSIDDYRAVWLPIAGYPRTIDFTSHKGVDPTTTVRINPDAGSAAVTSGVGAGLDYRVGVQTADIPSDKQLVDVPTAKLTMPPVTVIPDVVAAKAEEYAGDSDSAIQQLRNIERSLKKLGYLSHGLANDPVPSRAGEGADRMVDLFSSTPMVGDQEQYATAFALMARHLGYPVRVVMGFAPKVHEGEHTVTVRGSDVTAWDEVAFAGVGWVPFDPTPTKTDAPKAETTRPKIEPQPQVRQPPSMDQKHDEVLTPVKISDKNPRKKKDEPFVLPAWVYWSAGSILIPVLLLLAAFAVIGLAKRRRRRRRRGTGPPHARAAGSWDELVDNCAELGLDAPSRLTRALAADALLARCESQGLSMGSVDLTALAHRVDRAVFSIDESADAELDEMWNDASAATKAAGGSAGWLRRRLAGLRFHRRRTPRRPPRRSGAVGTIGRTPDTGLSGAQL